MIMCVAGNQNKSKNKIIAAILVRHEPYNLFHKQPLFMLSLNLRSQKFQHAGAEVTEMQGETLDISLSWARLYSYLAR